MDASDPPQKKQRTDAGPSGPGDCNLPPDRFLDVLLAGEDDDAPIAVVAACMRTRDLGLTLAGVTKSLRDALRALAQQHKGVTNHVHIYQGDSDSRMEGIYGISAMDFLEKCGWEGPDVIYYHFDTNKPDELKRVSEAGTWVSICISVDMRMGFCGPSGHSLPAVRELLNLGGNVCFGTTNPANNEGRGMIDDMRVALLAQRMRHDEPRDWITARDVLWFATKQAARGLGRDDLGAADLGERPHRGY